MSRSRTPASRGGTARRSAGVAGRLDSVAARIRHARERAGLEPHELRERLREGGNPVSKQLLHRYETIEAQNPSISIVAAIAAATGFSPGWLLFGQGPVFAIDPLTQVYRAVNLQAIYRRPGREWPTRARLRFAGLDAERVEALRSQPFVAVIDDQTARAIEAAADLGAGALDLPPGQVGRGSDARRLLDTVELTREALRLSDDQRAAFVDLLRALNRDAAK